MTKRKPKAVSDDIKISTFKYPDYFVGYCITMEIKARDYTDGSYHDAPSSFSIEMTLDDLRRIKIQLDEAIEGAERIGREQQLANPAQSPDAIHVE